MAEMQYCKIPYVEKDVSRILYGTASQPFLEGQNVDELLDAVFAAGINTFDTARAYGLSEYSLGCWIEKREIREQVVILSKCGHPDSDGRKRINEREIREDFKKSCDYLKTDYIDIYLLHRDDPSVETGMIVETLNALHSEGKIGAFGGSNWKHERIEEANEYAYQHGLIPFSISSPNFGLAEQVNDPWGGGCVTISGASNKAAREWYEKTQMPIIAYSSLGRGLFSGRVKSNEIEKASLYMDETALRGYGCMENFERLRRCEEVAKVKNCTVPQVAMAWIYGQKLYTFAVVSTTNGLRMKENIEALGMQLSDEELKYLNLEG